MIVERVHKPTVFMLHRAGILPTASAARAMLLAYYHLSSKRNRPCNVSCARIARDLGVDASAVRYALLRWKDAERTGKNGERRRSWKLTDSVTTCHAPQEQSKKRPMLENSVTPSHARACQVVTPERDAVSRATKEIELEKRDKEIALPALVFVDPKKQREIKSLENSIASARELSADGNELHTRELAKLEARLAKLRGSA